MERKLSISSSEVINISYLFSTKN